MTHDEILFAFMLPMLFVVIWVREYLSAESPRKKIAVGLVTLCLSVVFFAAAMKLLPRPVSTAAGFSLEQTGAMVSSSILGGGVVLSLMLVGGGLIQAFKRWNYYRRNRH